MTTREALEILGLSPTASEAEIKQAYRDMAKVWHPDRFPNDLRLRAKAEKKLKQINEAYHILSGYRPPRDSGSHKAQEGPHPGPQSSPSTEAEGRRSPPPPPSPTASSDPAGDVHGVRRARPWLIILGAIAAVILIANISNHSGGRRSPTRPLPSPERVLPPGEDTRSTSERGANSATERPKLSSSPSTSARASGPAAPVHSNPEPRTVTRPASRSPAREVEPSRTPQGSMTPVAAQQRDFFSVGSTKEEVLAVQGTPTEFNDRAWKYGLSSVYFDNDRVTKWRISPLNPLKAKMLPSGPEAGHPAFFSVGSTKDEVLAVQGTPTEFNDRAWKYGLSYVYFENGRVASWRISPLNPLRAKILSVKE